MAQDGGGTRTVGVLGMGLSALLSNPARTSLSTLGVVIGVASLVAVLAFGDGLAAMFELEQGPASSPGSFAVTPSTTERVDFVSVAPPALLDLSLNDLAAIEDRLGTRATVVLSSQFGTRVPRSAGDRVASAEAAGETAAEAAGETAAETSGDAPAGVERLAAGSAAWIVAVTPQPPAIPGGTVDRGRALEVADMEDRRAVAVVTSDALSLWGFQSADAALGREIQLLGQAFEVVGVQLGDPIRPGARIFIPFPFRNLPDFAGSLPSMRVSPTDPDDTEGLVREVREWLAEVHPGRPFSLQRTDGRMETTIQQIRAMQMIVGAIIGISILVGGIGIMNVMLASVLERTREIGIKRAMGARRRDVLVQFLAESVAVSAFGSLVGLLLGFGIALGGTALIRRSTGAPISAALTPGTLLLISLIAVVVGVVFGVYPATRAANLTPVDAMRHE